MLEYPDYKYRPRRKSSTCSQADRGNKSNRRRRISNTKIQRTKLNRSRSRCKAIRSSCSSWTSHESNDTSLVGEAEDAVKDEDSYHQHSVERDNSFLIDEQSTVSLPDCEQLHDDFSYTSFDEAFAAGNGEPGSGSLSDVDPTVNEQPTSVVLPRTNANESVININVFHNMDVFNSLDQYRNGHPIDIESYSTPEVDEMLLSDDWLISDANCNDCFTGVFDFI